jgi:mono/diheme cytochrome c family protein
MPTQRFRWFALLILLGITLTATGILAQAAPLDQDAVAGEQTYKAKCAACHTIGGGKLVGPDLKGVTARRETGWLKSMIATPDKLLASGDPTAAQLLKESNNVPMPNLALTGREVDDLLAFLATKSDGAAPATAAPGAAPATAPAADDTAAVLALSGSADAGAQLFAGSLRLQNGGMSCVACHSAASVGALGGGALGPDLTQVHTRYGRHGLAAALGSLPFPSMQGIFANKQLTTAEKADLLAFFAATSQRGEPRPLQNLLIALGVGTGLAGALFLGMAFFWPRQRLSVAQRLRKNGKL